MTSVSAPTNSEILSNYINATDSATEKAKAATEANSLWGDFDTFLNILTTQLKNQDPTEPVDPSEFTNQLVQYAEVEQQISANDKLDSILGALNSNGITPLLSYMGQYVETASSGKLVVQGGASMMAYTLDGAAESVTIAVQDDSGNVVAKIKGSTTEGLNRIAWDGKLDSGATAADGAYKYVLTAKDANGEVMTVSDVRIIGQVSSIETDADGEVSLKVGDLEIDDSQIISVFAGVTTADSSATQENASTPSS